MAEVQAQVLMLMAVRVVPAAAVSVAAAGGATTDGVPSLESGGANHDVLGLAAVQQERGLRGEKPGPNEEPRVGEVRGAGATLWARLEATN